ncbi:MAG TPA: enolase C-terminal domain-like protein [Bryobacteraceae bacterium]|nr:enolase C-terminal domain-like protein [Bryobacteraceae bacterium]
MERRAFLTLSALPFLSAQAQVTRSNLKIKDVWLERVEGERESLAGVDKQHQVQPLHIYDDQRPKEYRDAPNPQMTKGKASALYLRIETTGDVYGLYGPIDREAAVVVDLQLRPFLLGKDPLAGETLWDQLYRLNRHSRAGHYLLGVSAVDNALWDLRGRYFSTPVYRLLGGPTRPQVEAYASCLGYSLQPDAVATRSKAFQNEGFRYQKWFPAYGPGDGHEGLAKNIRLVRVLRETLGDSSEIMFDVFQGWQLDYALAWAKQVESLRPRWLEEAFPVDRIETFAQLRRSTSVPIASGEHFYGRWEANDYLKAGAISVVQADPEWCGGVSELVKICHIASLYDAQVIPHGHSLHAALHVVASQNPSTCPLVEYLVSKMQSYYFFEKNVLKPVAGKVKLPEGPGFGIELNDSVIQSRSRFKALA